MSVTDAVLLILAGGLLLFSLLSDRWYARKRVVPMVPEEEEIDRHDVHFACIQKHGETYLVFYHDYQREDAIMAIGRMAANPDLSLTWQDATRLVNQIRESALANSNS